MRLRCLATLGAAILSLAAVAPAGADPVSGASAQRQLFSAKGALVKVFNLPMLSEQDKMVIGELGKQQKYYGAIAISPDEGLMSEPTLAAANYHSIPPAETAARAACDKRRKRGTARCVIAAHILPPGYDRPRALQLSADATAGLARSYGKGSGPKALAISPLTGQWAMARGQGAGAAAVAECNRTATQNGARDCAVAVAD